MLNKQYYLTLLHLTSAQCYSNSMKSIQTPEIPKQIVTVMPEGVHPENTDPLTGWQGGILELISEDAKRWAQEGAELKLPALDPWDSNDPHHASIVAA